MDIELGELTPEENDIEIIIIYKDNINNIYLEHIEEINIDKKIK